MLKFNVFVVNTEMLQSTQVPTHDKCEEKLCRTTDLGGIFSHDGTAIITGAFIFGSRQVTTLVLSLAHSIEKAYFKQSILMLTLLSILSRMQRISCISTISSKTVRWFTRGWLRAFSVAMINGQFEALLFILYSIYGHVTKIDSLIIDFLQHPLTASL